VAAHYVSIGLTSLLVFDSIMSVHWCIGLEASHWWIVKLMSVAGKVIARLNVGDAIKCRHTWTSYVTWCQHAVHWHANLTNWRFFAWPFHTWKLCAVC